MKEEITKAYHDAQFSRKELQEAYGKSDNLAGIIIFDLLMDASDIEKKLKQLNKALEVD